MLPVALLLVGMAGAAEPEPGPFRVCLSDGQGLAGTRLVHVQDDTNAPATMELEVGGAFVRIPPSEGGTEIHLLDEARIYVPHALVLDVTAPEKKDRIVATARRKQALHITALTAATTFVAGAFVVGAVTCPECFILSGL